MVSSIDILFSRNFFFMMKKFDIHTQIDKYTIINNVSKTSLNF